MPTAYEHLKPYATERELQVIEAVEKTSYRKAAKALGLSEGTVSRHMARVKYKAELQADSPVFGMTHPLPNALKIKRLSNRYDKEGKLAGQWVIGERDDHYRELMWMEAIEAMKDEIPRAKLIPAPPALRDDLVNCYVLTDYHLGMLAWAPEAGEDWDISIAEDLLVKFFSMAIAQSPPANYAVFAQLSDFLHFDGMDAVTPQSKHLLDADTRFSKLVRVAIRVLRRIIAMLLTKHQHVHIIMADANHDPVSQIWLREWLSVLYEEEPRITVDTSPSPYNAYEFGKTALFFHHGHKRKVETVAEVFAAKFREIFGRTTHAYAHTGHLHTAKVIENNLMKVEQHNTLCPSDAYAARGGWLSGREAKVITYHRRGGEVSRITINSGMLG